MMFACIPQKPCASYNRVLPVAEEGTTVWEAIVFMSWLCGSLGDLVDHCVRQDAGLDD